ncbi:MAG: type II toxin-antitoxin system VapC family toxin [Bifidobacteriaceae bacterium]|jgi:predicted nucleic acid-binding protein|nr:type II toxin-antitoxin system VapC family toxin [Bifidobacteriaceae bacterium]
MIVLDASVLIAYLQPADAHHANAVQILKRTEPGRMLVHSITLAEVLAGPAQAGREVDLERALNRIGVRVAATSPDEPVALARLRATTGRKLPDCCVLLVAQHLGAELATFDRALAEPAKRLGLTVHR